MNSFDVATHNGFGFYVVDDLKSRDYKINRFQSMNEALTAFRAAVSVAGGIPALGVEVGAGSLDLVHRVNGNYVLVQEYKNENLSDAMLAVRGQLDKIVAILKDEIGVTHTYNHVFFDRIGRSCPVIAPIGKKDDGFDNSYCADRRLKTVSGFGFDSINQLFIVGHGWVDYKKVREDPEAFCENGVICVEGVNVNYVLNKNFVGVNGQMDISVHDFSTMLQDVNKEFSLRVYEARLDNSYIVGSYDNIMDAVRAWYELPAGLTAQVNQTIGYSYQQPVFNGVDDNFDEIPYEKAAEMYGFENEGVERLIADATGKSVQKAHDNSEKFVQDVEKE